MNDQTLERIRQKELQLQAGLLAARQHAEALVRDATFQSESIRLETEQQTADEIANLRERLAADTERQVAEAQEEYSRQAARLAAGAELAPLLTARILDAVVHPTEPLPSVSGLPTPATHARG